MLASTYGVTRDLNWWDWGSRPYGIRPETSSTAWSVFPWNYLLVPLGRRLGLPTWYEHLAGAYIVNNMRIFLLYLPGAFLNAAIVYWIGKIIDDRWDKI